MIKIDATPLEQGVELTFTGAVSKQEMEERIASCSAGECSCGCDPELFQKIEGMEVSGEEGAVRLRLQGRDLPAEALKAAAQSCMSEG